MARARAAAVPAAAADAAAGAPHAASDGTCGVLVTVAYDGAPFAGFAPQPGQRTVAGVLLEAVRALDPDVASLRGASRTDAGVHARGQRVAFDTKRAAVPPRGWVLGVSRNLPPQVAVRRASRVPAGFAPRFQTVDKHYRYLVLRDVVRDPFLEGRAWRAEGLGGRAAIGLALAEAEAARGTHDFAAFRSSADERATTVRTLHEVSVSIDPADERLLRVDVRGDAFLHNMVRILVGTLVDVARGRLRPGAVARALASRDRRDAGMTAPPDGLCLEHVTLRDEGADAWPER